MSTAQATVQPTIGLLPIPRNPIISTCAGTDEERDKSILNLSDYVNFDLKSVGYEEKEKGQTLISEDLSTFAPELGLEPRTL